MMKAPNSIGSMTHFSPFVVAKKSEIHFKPFSISGFFDSYILFEIMGTCNIYVAVQN